MQVITYKKFIFLDFNYNISYDPISVSVGDTSSQYKRSRVMFKKKGIMIHKERLVFFLPAFLLTLAGFIAAYQFVAPSPPRTITIATGGPDGAYFKYGNTYKKLLKENKVELKIRTTAGSFENLQLLEKESDGVDIAFIQGGLENYPLQRIFFQ